MPGTNTCAYTTSTHTRKHERTLTQSMHVRSLIAIKSRTNKYILELWQSEWDEFPENKLHQIFPVLKECIVCPRTNRKEETVMARLHVGHSFITHSFLLKGEEPPMCIGCDKRLTIEHILLICSDFIEIRESHFTAKSLRMLFKDISPEKIFNFWREKNRKNLNLRFFLVCVFTF